MLKGAFDGSVAEHVYQKLIDAVGTNSEIASDKNSACLFKLCKDFGFFLCPDDVILCKLAVLLVRAVRLSRQVCP